MDHTERESALPLRPERSAGEWYVKGFADGYHAHMAVSPLGAAGEQYNKGYNEGLETALRDCFAESWDMSS